jgi:hydrogenase maturation factor HypF (carbamoyltransferase family)
MGSFSEFQTKISGEVMSKFRQAGALSKDTARSLSDIGIFPKENPEHRLGFSYLKSMWYVRKYSNDYYLDEKAVSNPVKTYLKKVAYVFCITFPILLVLSALMVMLLE